MLPDYPPWGGFPCIFFSKLTKFEGLLGPSLAQISALPRGLSALKRHLFLVLVFEGSMLFRSFTTSLECCTKRKKCSLELQIQWSAVITRSSGATIRGALYRQRGITDVIAKLFITLLTVDDNGGFANIYQNKSCVNRSRPLGRSRSVKNKPTFEKSSKFNENDFGKTCTIYRKIH